MQGGFLPGVSEGAEELPRRPRGIRRINEPLVFSLGLMKPRSKGCPPQDLHSCRTHPKMYLPLAIIS